MNMPLFMLHLGRAIPCKNCTQCRLTLSQQNSLFNCNCALFKVKWKMMLFHHRSRVCPPRVFVHPCRQGTLTLSVCVDNINYFHQSEIQINSELDGRQMMGQPGPASSKVKSLLRKIFFQWVTRFNPRRCCGFFMRGKINLLNA